VTLTLITDTWVVIQSCLLIEATYTANLVWIGQSKLKLLSENHSLTSFRIRPPARLPAIRQSNNQDFHWKPGIKQPLLTLIPDEDIYKSLITQSGNAHLTHFSLMKKCFCFSMVEMRETRKYLFSRSPCSRSMPSWARLRISSLNCQGNTRGTWVSWAHQYYGTILWNHFYLLDI